MSLLLFFVVATAAGVASLLAYRQRPLSAAFGLAGLVFVLLVATRIGSTDVLSVGGAYLAGSDYARLFLVFGSLAGLLNALIALATTWSVALPGAWLLVLAGTSLAFTLADPLAAVSAATLGALAGVVVTIGPIVTSFGLEVARRELRALIAACVLALGAAGIASGQATIGLDPTVVGLALVAFVGAAAIRLGAIPFHLWVARAADTTPPIALSLVMAWAPAAFVGVALAWLQTTIVPLGESFWSERAVIVLIAGLTIVLGSVAATLHADLEHVVGYSIVADGAVALLGLAVLDAAAWGPTRQWLLALALAKSAFAAWVAAVHFTYGARQIGELDGWARRSPVLAAGLLAVFLASIGLPGMLVFRTRIDLARLALPAPLAVALLLMSIVSLAYYARLAVIGLRRPSVAVSSGADPRLRGLRRLRMSGVQAGELVSVLRLNRAPIAAFLVLVISILAVGVSAGGFGLETAASGARPAPALPLALTPGASPSP